MIGIRGILGATASAGIGVVTVALGSKYVESMEPAPPFSMTRERFDLSTMKGRFAKQLSNCDPGTLLAREKEIKEAEALLKKFELEQIDKAVTSDDELWAARKLVGSAVHPDTRDIIPEPFRMSGYVPFNGPVCVAMMATQSTGGLLFWNWINQSQNALVNYFNRNASSPTSNDILVKSYAGAVGAALAVAFGLSQFIKRRYSPAQAQKLMKFVAFPASMVASCSNCYIMRRPEITTGVSITDEHGKDLISGKRSSVAAKKAVMETVMSRGILQVPVFFVPAVVLTLPPIAALCVNPATNITLTTLITIISFGFGLPAAVAYFPQLGSLEVEELEPELRKLLPAKTKTVYYNKGL